MIIIQYNSIFIKFVKKKATIQRQMLNKNAMDITGIFFYTNSKFASY